LFLIFPSYSYFSLSFHLILIFFISSHSTIISLYSSTSFLFSLSSHLILFYLIFLLFSHILIFPSYSYFSLSFQIIIISHLPSHALMHDFFSSNLLIYRYLSNLSFYFRFILRISLFSVFSPSVFQSLFLPLSTKSCYLSFSFHFFSFSNYELISLIFCPLFYPLFFFSRNIISLPYPTNVSCDYIISYLTLQISY